MADIAVIRAPLGKQSVRSWLAHRCAFVYKRHSKSIDTDRMACGMCSGRLMFRGKFLPDGTPAKTRAPNAFSDFVKDHFAGIKAAHPAGAPWHTAPALPCSVPRSHRAAVLWICFDAADCDTWWT